jgi:hypothetical protein
MFSTDSDLIRYDTASLNDELGNIQWTDIGSNIIINPFSKYICPNILISSPLQLFMEFCTDGILEVIVNETNRYAGECLNLDGASDMKWDTCAEEIIAFIGFTLLIGINKLPHLYDYWSTSQCFHYYPVASRTAQHRFLEIKALLTLH